MEHWPDSGTECYSNAVAATQLFVTLDAAVELHTFAEGTELLSSGDGARPAE